MVSLNANEKTAVCTAALEAKGDEHLIELWSNRVYELAGAAIEDVFVYTSSGAEAVNQVLWSVFLHICRKEGKCHFVTSILEDAPTLQMMQRLEDLGCFVKIAPVNERGEIDLIKLAEMITPRTALISITMAQGLTGVIQPYEEIVKLAKEKGVLLHLDATQAMGKLYFTFDADYLTFSGNRIHALPHSGGLFAKKGAPLAALIVGDCTLRAGPCDVRGHLGLCNAAQQASFFLDAMSLETARLLRFFEKEVLRLIPDARILFADSLRLSNTSCIVFPRVHQEALQFFLEEKVDVSIGGGTSPHLHRLLKASNLHMDAECAVSFSLSRMTTQEELVIAAKHLFEAVSTLRTISEGVCP